MDLYHSSFPEQDTEYYSNNTEHTPLELSQIA